MSSPVSAANRPWAVRFLPLASLALPCAAHADEYFTLDVSGGASVTTNSGSTSHNSPVGVTASASPAYTSEGETYVYRLSGFGSVTQYMDGSDMDNAGSFAFDGEKRLSTRTTIEGRASYGYRKEQNGGRSSLENASPDLPAIGLDSGTSFSLDEQPLLADFDPTLIGRTVKVSTLQGALAYKRILSQRASLNVSIDGASIDYDQPDYQDTRTLRLSSQYNIQKSERLEWLVASRFERYSQDRAFYGQGVVPSRTIDVAIANFGIVTKLRSTSELRIMAGPTLVRHNGKTAPAKTSIDFTLDASICNSGKNDSICAFANREQAPTAIGGVRLTNSGGLFYQKMFGKNDILALSGRIDRRSADRDALVSATTGAGFSARLTRELRRTIRGYISAGFDSVWTDGAARRDNISLSVGITKKFGRNQ